ncbi:transposase zinc-binding domain-containing protein [Streptobacillus felis]|uniref:transposase zinc-binding domain-containing protein n=1 Tax=Streptobacillus felis TaxID=1384509 RepID=UPI0012E3B107|nr:transposase zinc-binding domain-containing protein [Streptobacillus felis]
MFSKIKFIFTNSIKKFFSNKHIEHIKNSINKFLACGDLNKGFVTYRCPNCDFKHKMKLTCKSRLYNSCGYNYSIKWTNSITNHVINIPS